MAQTQRSGMSRVHGPTTIVVSLVVVKAFDALAELVVAGTADGAKHFRLWPLVAIVVRSAAFVAD